MKLRLYVISVLVLALLFVPRLWAQDTQADSVLKAREAALAAADLDAILHVRLLRRCCCQQKGTTRSAHLSPSFHTGSSSREDQEDRCEQHWPIYFFCRAACNLAADSGVNVVLKNLILSPSMMASCVTSRGETPSLCQSSRYTLPVQESLFPWMYRDPASSR